MEKIISFLRKSPAFYVATVSEDGKPKVRPFSLVFEFEGRLTFGTNTDKPVYHQLKANPSVEICSFDHTEGRWMRLYGRTEFLDSVEAKKKVFETMPSLKDIYGSEENPVLVCFSIVEGQADFYSFGPAEPDVVISI